MFVLLNVFKIIKLNKKGIFYFKKRSSGHDIRYAEETK